VPVDEKVLRCRGGFGTILLHADRMTISESSWRIAKSYELPIKRVRSVIVERKSVMPFATTMILSAIIAVVVKCNGLWFLVSLNPKASMSISSAILAVAAISAVPTLLRGIFVNVEVTWDGNPSYFRVRLIPNRMGRRLASRFRELSEGS
jgi:hypothetical protein